jgi:hypothetical protein
MDSRREAYGKHGFQDSKTIHRMRDRFSRRYEVFVERVTGLEPATFCLGSKHSTN